MPIELYFVPNSDKEVNFNLVCRVKRKVLPVTLNVKAEGYAMNCQLLCEDSQGVNKEFVSDGINIIRFGEVHKGVKQLTAVLIFLYMKWKTKQHTSQYKTFFFIRYKSKLFHKIFIVRQILMNR